MKRFLLLFLCVMIAGSSFIGIGMHSPVMASPIRGDIDSLVEEPVDPPPTPPTTPSEVTAKVISSSQIDLSWKDNSNDETGFIIERRSDEGITTIMIAANGIQHSDTGLSPNTTYHYKVKATNNGLDSSFTNEISVTTLPVPVTPPAKPTGLAATAHSTSEIRLTWNAGAGNVDGYEIERKTVNGNYQLISSSVGGKSTSFNDTGGAPNTRYYYRIRAYNSGGTSPYSDEAHATTQGVIVAPPAKPSNLVVSSISSDRINLTWADHANNESGYKVERKTGNGNFTEITVLGPNSTTYGDTGVSPNTTYTYRVRAYNSGGNSDYSNEISGTTISIPAAPTNLEITNVTTDRISISWKDNANNEKGFKIERKIDNGNWSEVTTVGANVTSYTNTGLANNRSYSYRVRAYNDAGNSGYSNEVSANTGGAPEKPTNLQITNVGTDRISISWKDNANNEKGFKIERKIDNGNWSEITTVGANVTSYTNTGLTSNRSYSYRVRAYNDAGNSGYSNEVSANTGGAPEKPTNLQITNVGTDRISISWKDNANNEKGFKIERKIDNGNWSEVTTVGANVTSYTNTGLTNNRSYSYRVRAYNDAGNSGYSNEVSANTGGVPEKPTNLQITNVGTDRISISWKDNANNEKGFKIERKIDNGNWSEITTVGANVTSYTNTGLTNNRSYSYRVRAYNDAGNSSYSNEVSSRPGDIPDRPTNLEITSTSSDRITISWKDNSNNEKGFKIERKIDNGNWSEITTVGANITSYTNTGLTNNRSYSYRVRAYNDAGNSGYSNEVSANTGGVPEKPTNLEITSVTSDRISISWRDRSDNEKGFKIERKIDNGSWSEITTVGADVTSYTNRDLSNNRSYSYRVRAYNDAGNSGYSNEVSAKTDNNKVVTKLYIGSTIYYVNDQLREMDAAPIIMEGRTLLPIKYVAEAIGASVKWNSREEKITVELKDNYIELWIGSNVARVNGARRLIDANNVNVKPVIIPPGRTMLPLKFIVENLGCKVDWNDRLQEVKVTYPAK